MICFRGTGTIPNPVLHGSTFILTGIFQRAGIRLVVVTCPSTPVLPGGPWLIEARFTGEPPIQVNPAALAYAQPFNEESSGITILYNRVMNVFNGGPKSEAAILAHVLAHEIGHTLQAVDRHSATGVMKAHWKSHDFADMSMRAWDFTPDDVDRCAGDGCADKQSAWQPYSRTRP